MTEEVVLTVLFHEHQPYARSEQKGVGPNEMVPLSVHYQVAMNALEDEAG